MSHAGTKQVTTLHAYKTQNHNDGHLRGRAHKPSRRCRARSIARRSIVRLYMRQQDTLSMHPAANPNAATPTSRLQRQPPLLVAAQCTLCSMIAPYLLRHAPPPPHARGGSSQPRCHYDEDYDEVADLNASPRPRISPNLSPPCSRPSWPRSGHPVLHVSSKGWPTPWQRTPPAARPSQQARWRYLVPTISRPSRDHLATISRPSRDHLATISRPSLDHLGESALVLLAVATSHRCSSPMSRPLLLTTSSALYASSASLNLTE